MPFPFVIAHFSFVKPLMLLNDKWKMETGTVQGCGVPTTRGRAEPVGSIVLPL